MINFLLTTAQTRAGSDFLPSDTHSNFGDGFYDITHQIYTQFLVTDTYTKKGNFNHDDHALIMFKLRKKGFAFVVDFVCSTMIKMSRMSS